MRPLRHFYHLCVDLDWAAPAQEHVLALLASGLACPVTVSMVGSSDTRMIARDWFERVLPDHKVSFFQADSGHEDVALRRVQEWAQAVPAGAVLYMHAKGSLDTSVLNQLWRQDMTHRLLCNWRMCVMLLDGKDAVGCHWVTSQEQNRSIFGGNFWWANCAYLARLPEPVVVSDRHEAEHWVGLNDPDIADLHPGWPGPALFPVAPPPLNRMLHD